MKRVFTFLAPSYFFPPFLNPSSKTPSAFSLAFPKTNTTIKTKYSIV